MVKNNQKPQHHVYIPLILSTKKTITKRKEVSSCIQNCLIIHGNFNSRIRCDRDVDKSDSLLDILVLDIKLVFPVMCWISKESLLSTNPRNR